MSGGNEGRDSGERVILFYSSKCKTIVVPVLLYSQMSEFFIIKI